MQKNKSCLDWARLKHFKIITRNPHCHMARNTRHLRPQAPYVTVRVHIHVYWKDSQDIGELENKHHNQSTNKMASSFNCLFTDKNRSLPTKEKLLKNL